MLFRSKAKRLNERNANHHPRFGIFGQPVARRAIDQGVKIGQMAKRFAGDGMGKRAVSRMINPARCRRQCRFKRLATAQDSIKQFKRGAARGKASNFGNECRLS